MKPTKKMLFAALLGVLTATGSAAVKIATSSKATANASETCLKSYPNSLAAGSVTVAPNSNADNAYSNVSAPAVEFAKKPYVPYKKPYSMSPTTSSVRVLWQLPDTAAIGVVRYGKTLALGDSVVAYTGWNVPGEGFVHVVELTGLEAFTTYYYQVGDGTRWFAEIHQAKTAPQVGTPFCIFTISDIHENAYKNWENMQEYVKGLHPDLGMFIGDFVNEGNLRAWNQSFFTPGEPLLAQMTFAGAVGNHETGDPVTYRYSTYYDYVSLPSHGQSEDSIKDPRGEAYFAFNYGDAKIIALNLNGDASSPSFAPNSMQYTWLNNQLANATNKWILVFAHVGIYTSGYHGEWSANQKAYIAPLLEQYARAGKHIICFAGDDHSFEHLYKAGVHYVRPGCGRDANYAQKKALIDAQYSLYYKQISCFSTLCMAGNGESITLTAHDSIGNEFYSYTFVR